MNGARNTALFRFLLARVDDFWVSAYLEGLALLILSKTAREGWMRTARSMTRRRNVDEIRLDELISSLRVF